MAFRSDTKIEQYAAWPTDVVKDSSGIVVGFTMRKLSNYVPLHMLFSPMDRKRIFPEKGYDFLVHVSRNLCAAFHTLHSFDLIVGDVNEGNILVDQRGMIAFIDCDSFQVREGSNYHFCEVGVPPYTPPELLAIQSFDGVLRTVNTDSFSMAVLIFQLLFLGRHPFAGKNLTSEEIDIETAIRQYLYAYSQNSTGRRKLSPPNDSLPAANISSGMTVLFSRAFEQERDRPGPVEWGRELEQFSKVLIQCTKSKIHKYSKHLPKCPWCEFKETRNIVFFFDDDAVGQVAAIKDIDTFINGFRIERPNTPNYQPVPAESYNLDYFTIKPVYRNFKKFHWLSILLASSISIWLFSTYNVAPFACIIGVITLHFALPWRRHLKAVANRLENEVSTKKKLLKSTIEEYVAPSELKTFDQKAAQMQSLVREFKGLPLEFTKRKSEIESNLYNSQLQSYLSNFYIRNYKIPQIGDARKQSLIAAGIRTAAEISKLRSKSIKGIGPTYEQNLYTWQRQVASNFVYKPDHSSIAREIDRLSAELAQKKVKLESQIKAEYMSLNYLKAGIKTKQNQINTRLDQLQREAYQAELDLEQFRKLAG